MGNVVSTGTHTRPSDRRVKEDIVDINTKDAINRLAQVRVVEYAYKPEIAKEWGLDESSRHRVGVIAQELAQVIPDAVRDNGEFLTVDDTRIFYDTVAAAQELYRLTGNLECKIDQVEKISAKLARFAKNKNKMGSMASGLSDLSTFLGRGEDGKSLSYSRASLASTATTCTEKSRGKRRSTRNNQNEGSLCNSRFTQLTIVSLVVIMALCLLAMCTLYVLDWYNRNYVYSTHIPIMTVPGNGPDAVGNIIQLTNNVPLSWIPPTQPFAPILASVCGLRNQCPQHCCMGTPKFSSDDELGMDNTTASIISKSSDLLPPAINLLNKDVKMQILNLNVSLDQRFCVENSCKPKTGRYNLYVPISPFLPTIPLHIRFYVKEDKYVDNCGSLRDFVHKPCQYEKDSVNIGISKEPTAYMMGENTFELSVGNFMQSAYRFRVGFTTESCNMSEDQQGRSFEEYNIVFYRKCSTNSTL
uniref:Peptidase S74 domain-containing protein n=1 Tax=Panagrolaimus sp. JU765 TaxID=591449 RepID=A0AC34Q5E5_9BILA